VIEIEQMGRDGARQMGKGAQMVERGGQFCPAAKAVAHHARDPAGMGGAGAHHAGDFLGQRAGDGPGGVVAVEVIERGLLAPTAACAAAKPPSCAA
jgi:hypothetical protein